MTLVRHLSGTRVNTNTWKVVDVCKDLFANTWKVMNIYSNLTFEAFDQSLRGTKNHSINSNFDVPVSYNLNRDAAFFYFSL